MNKPAFVFLDPLGRCWLWVRILLAVSIMIPLTAFVFFIRAL